MPEVYEVVIEDGEATVSSRESGYVRDTSRPGGYYVHRGEDAFHTPSSGKPGWLSLEECLQWIAQQGRRVVSVVPTGLPHTLWIVTEPSARPV